MDGHLSGEIRPVTEVGKICQAEGTHQQGSGRKFLRKISIQNNYKGHCHWSRLFTWKNAALE